MEATGEVESLPEKIRPPRLEDAGLEDCALPPDSITEAFLKAASAVGSRAASIFSASDEEEGRCVSDPWPNVGEESDTLVGIRDGVDPPPGPCASKKGGGVPEVKADKVVVAGPEVTEGKDCVNGLRGLKIEEGGGKKSKNEEEDEEERESERPILAEAYV